MTMYQVRRWMPLIVLVALCICIGVVEPRFLTLGNLIRIASSSAMPIVVALGATFIIMMGSIDLSIEGSLAFCGAVLVSFSSSQAAHNLGLLSVPIAILAGGAFGAAIGYAHVKMKIPSFMASLGLGFVGIGIATLILGGERVPVGNDLVRAIAIQRIADVPISVFIAMLALSIAWAIQYHTKLGRHIVAIGGGEELARVSGVNVEKTRVWAFAIAGLFFGTGAVIACARLGAASALIGTGQLFAAISAVVVGGTALTGGQGGVINTLVGVLIVMVISNGMIIVGLPTYIQQGVLGAAIIAAVLINMSGKVPALVK